MAGLKDMMGASKSAQLFDLPKTDLEDLSADIVVFGADCATPYANVGPYCAGGPAAMRKGGADYNGAMSKMNFDLGGPTVPDGVVAVDAGDLSVKADDPEANRAAIRSATSKILAAGAVPMLLGGDDSLPTPMLEAFAALGRPITILQIDAHIDWRDEVQGTRFGLSSTMRRASEMAHVERIVQVGLRGVGSARVSDYQDALDWGAVFVMADEVAQSGYVRAVDAIPEGSDVVVCFDCDGLDPAIMPSVIAPTNGGLSYQQALGLIRAIATKARIAGFDLVEFMPSADVNGQGARTAAQLLAGVLGTIARQRAA